MQVDEIMNRQVVTCDPRDTLLRAAELMWQEDVGALPVTEGGRVLGVITDRDLTIAACTLGHRLDNLHVATVLSGDVFTCQPHDSISFAQDLMCKYGVRRLPVVQDEVLVGVLSLADLARAAQRAQDAQSALAAVGNTLACICDRRPNNAVLAEAPREAASPQSPNSSTAAGS